MEVARRGRRRYILSMHGSLRVFTLLVVLAGILTATGGQNSCLSLRAGGMGCCKATHPCASTGIKAVDCCRFSPAAPSQSPAAVTESTTLRDLRLQAKSFLDAAGEHLDSVPLPSLMSTLVLPGEIDSGPSLARYLLNSSLRR